MTTKKQVILFTSIILIFGAIFLTANYYIQKNRAYLELEEMRCGQFDPHDGNYDNTQCIRAGCRGSGHGEWSCVPNSIFYRDY